MSINFLCDPLWSFVVLCVIAFNNYCTIYANLSAVAHFGWRGSTKCHKPVRRNHYGRRGEKNSHVKPLLLLCFSTLISNEPFIRYTIQKYTLFIIFPHKKSISTMVKMLNVYLRINFLVVKHNRHYQHNNMLICIIFIYWNNNSGSSWR